MEVSANGIPDALNFNTRNERLLRVSFGNISSFFYILLDPSGNFAFSWNACNSQTCSKFVNFVDETLLLSQQRSKFLNYFYLTKSYARETINSSDICMNTIARRHHMRCSTELCTKQKFYVTEEYLKNSNAFSSSFSRKLNSVCHHNSVYTRCVSASVSLKVAC